MPETNISNPEKMYCPSCNGQFYPENPKCGDILICPNCHRNWRIDEVGDTWMKVEQVIPENPIHKCPMTDKPAIQYFNSHDYEPYPLRYGSGWYIYSKNAYDMSLEKINYCPHCGQKLDPDPSIPAQRLEINRVQALELD
jgi:uncharacterized protein YbaR (Trm112 family)